MRLTRGRTRESKFGCSDR